MFADGHAKTIAVASLRYQGDCEVFWVTHSHVWRAPVEGAGGGAAVFERFLNGTLAIAEPPASGAFGIYCAEA